jgi:PAS domain S-box-containing protein
MSNAPNPAPARRPEDTVFDRRDWLQITLSSIGDGVITADPDGRVNYLNPVAEALTGWTLTEAAGEEVEQVFRIVNETTREAVEQPVRKSIERGQTVGLGRHTLLVARDGSERPIDDGAAAIKDARGDVVGVVLIFRDITERRRAERALEEAERRKDEFLAVMAHELRNPLSAIGMAAHLLPRAGSEAERSWSLGVIGHQVKTLNRLIEDLLDVSRISEGKIHLRKEVVDLASVIARAVESVTALVMEREHELTVSVPPEPMWVEGDPTRLEQVFGNLLTNAAKYPEKGGRITVTAAVEAGDSTVRVRDTGEGIGPEMLPRLFEMFTQVASSTPRSRGGLGIGLSLARTIVEMHGGSVDVASEGVGLGSEFFVRLPAVVRAAAGLGSVPSANGGA